MILMKYIIRAENVEKWKRFDWILFNFVQNVLFGVLPPKTCYICAIIMELATVMLQLKTVNI